MSESVFHVLIDFLNVLSASRGKRVRDLQNLRKHTLGFPRHAEQNTIRILSFCFLMSTLESLSYSPVLRLLEQSYPFNTLSRETRQHTLLSPLVTRAKSFPEFFSTSQIAFLWKEKNGCWENGCRIRWCRS